MWPRLLDLSEDECRGILRRLELESYSNVLGAFRAQGTLNAVKLRILKDLRETFHISDARHKAEVRRVVNDESLSTIAKVTYGPNTEIEWNKEGSRGFVILNRKPAQTALAALANKATELGDTLNKHLKSPAQTNRQRTLQIDNDAQTSADKKLVTDDPTNIKSTGKLKPEKVAVAQTPNASETKKRDTTKQQQQQQQQLQPPPNSSNNAIVQQRPPGTTKAATAVAVNTSTNVAENGSNTFVEKMKQSELLKVMEMAMPSPSSSSSIATLMPRSAPNPSPITANSRRRKSISVANHTPVKAMMISNRRDTMMEYPKIREHHPPESIKRPDQLIAALQQQQHKKAAATNNVRTVGKIELPPASAAPVFNATSSNSPLPVVTTSSLSSTPHPNNNDVQIIEAFMPHNVGTIKGTRNINAAIQKGAQLVKVIDSKIIKQPVNLSNMYVTTTAGKSIPPTSIQIQQQQQQQPVKVPTIKQHQIAMTETLPQSTYNAQKIQVITAKPQSPMAQNVIQKSAATNRNDIISIPSIPTARNPNIVKTSGKTVMHVPSHLLSQKSNQIIKTTLGSAASITHHHTTITASPAAKKHVVQVVTPQSQPRMVTIHPNSMISNVSHQLTTINESPQAEYIYENDWQNYDPSAIEQPNGGGSGYVKIINRSRNQHDASHNDYDYQNHESEIITEDNIIYDGGGSGTDDDIITEGDIVEEEYITTDDYSMDNVIEMDTDGSGTIYTTNDNVVTFISNNIIGS